MDKEKIKKHVDTFDRLSTYAFCLLALGVGMVVIAVLGKIAPKIYKCWLWAYSVSPLLAVGVSMILVGVILWAVFGIRSEHYLKKLEFEEYKKTKSEWIDSVAWNEYKKLHWWDM